jgi:hypothetical protein
MKGGLSVAAVRGCAAQILFSGGQRLMLQKKEILKGGKLMAGKTSYPITWRSNASGKY